MAEQLQAGMIFEKTITVTDALTAKHLAGEGVAVLSTRTVPLTRWPFVGQGWPILAWPLAGFFLISSVAVVVRALLDGSALRVPWAFVVALGSTAGFGWFVGNTLGRLGTHWPLDESRGVWLYTRGLERPALRSDPLNAVTSNQGWFSSSFLIPAAGILAAKFIPMKPENGLALIVLACAPGGMSALQFLSKKKEPAALAYGAGTTALLSFLAVFITPFLVGLAVPKGVELTVPYGRAFMFVALFMLLPLVIGILVHGAAEAAAAKLSGPIALIATLAFIAGMVKLLGLTKWAKGEMGKTGLIAIAVFILVSILVGWLLGGPLKFTRPVLATASSMFPRCAGTRRTGRDRVRTAAGGAVLAIVPGGRREAGPAGPGGIEHCAWSFRSLRRSPPEVSPACFAAAGRLSRSTRAIWYPTQRRWIAGAAGSRAWGRAAGSACRGKAARYARAGFSDRWRWRRYCPYCGFPGHSS